MDRLLVAVVTDGFTLSATLALLLAGVGLLADCRKARRPRPSPPRRPAARAAPGAPG